MPRSSTIMGELENMIQPMQHLHRDLRGPKKKGIKNALRSSQQGGIGPEDTTCMFICELAVKILIKMLQYIQDKTKYRTSLFTIKLQQWKWISFERFTTLWMVWHQERRLQRTQNKRQSLSAPGKAPPFSLKFFNLWQWILHIDIFTIMFNSIF